ncbi:ABC transporter ATP-binding protein [Candidatus Parcubacteria bacterium]|nr:ABC transporter ATP-binding protein [Candidatus Parcubacteria bacterium]
MNVVIKLENVWKIYRLGKIEVIALRKIYLEIKKGTFLSIIGPSGSGKSTLLNIIGCLDFPTKGKVFLDGIDVQSLSEDQLAQVRGKKIGFVFQQFNLLQNLSAIENVILPMIFQKVPEKERIERAKKLLAEVGLKERMLHKPFELSGGEQQRVAIARALANDPEIIIADEPTGNLDSKSGKLVMETFKKFYETEKKTIVIVTHDPEIASFSREIVRIKDGEIIQNDFQTKSILWSNKK